MGRGRDPPPTGSRVSWRVRRPTSPIPERDDRDLAIIPRGGTTVTDDRSWHDKSAAAVLDAQESGPHGLGVEEADRRLARLGPNELTVDGGRSPLRIFLAQFSSALVWVLFGAAAVALVVGHTIDAVLIATILLANGAFGFVQEYRAEHSLEALHELSVPTVTVRRAGRTETVPATALVPGDVVLLEGGDVVPADARLLGLTVVVGTVLALPVAWWIARRSKRPAAA